MLYFDIFINVVNISLIHLLLISKMINLLDALRRDRGLSGKLLLTSSSSASSKSAPHSSCRRVMIMKM